MQPSRIIGGNERLYTNAYNYPPMVAHRDNSNAIKTYDARYQQQTRQDEFMMMRRTGGGGYRNNNTLE